MTYHRACCCGAACYPALRWTFAGVDAGNCPDCYVLTNWYHRTFKCVRTTVDGYTDSETATAVPDADGICTYGWSEPSPITGDLRTFQRVNCVTPRFNVASTQATITCTTLHGQVASVRLTLAYVLPVMGRMGTIAFSWVGAAELGDPLPNQLTCGSMVGVLAVQSHTGTVTVTEP